MKGLFVIGFFTMCCFLCCIVFFFVNPFKLDTLLKTTKKLDVLKVFKKRSGSNKGEHLFDVHIRDNKNNKFCSATGAGVKCDQTTTPSNMFSVYKYDQPANGYLLKSIGKFCKWDNDGGSQRMLCNQSSPKEGINHSKSMKWMIDIKDDLRMSIKNRQTNKYCSLPDGFTDMKCDWDTPYYFNVTL